MSADYRLTSTGYIVRNKDGAWIPPDPRNADFQEYQRWLDAGNEADPADGGSP